MLDVKAIVADNREKLQSPVTEFRKMCNGREMKSKYGKE